MRYKLQDDSSDGTNQDGVAWRLKIDFLSAVAAVKQAHEMHESACRMQHHAKLATHDSHVIRAAADAQVKMVTKLNGDAVKDGGHSGFGGLKSDGVAELTEVLKRAIATTRADMGNIQLLDPSGASLRIQVQLGFDQRFLDFFDKVHDGEAACGTALAIGTQVVVEDVTESPIFLGADSLEVMLDARARAVQSTPLISASGYVIGMLSTHYRRPTRPSERDLRLVELLARRAARLIER